MLLSCLFVSFSFFGQPTIVTAAPNPFVPVDSLAEEVSYYKNGTIRSRERIQYNSRGELYTSIEETFWRNGKRKYRGTYKDAATISYEADYNKKGLLKAERYYIYNSLGILTRIYTKQGGSSREQILFPEQLPMPEEQQQ